MKRIAIFLGATLALLLAAIAISARIGEAPHARTAIASIQPLADMVRNVAGSEWRVVTLLPPGASPHTFEPTPRQMREVAGARAFFRVGLDLEIWADRLLAASARADLHVATVSGGIEAHLLGEHAEIRIDGHEHHEDCEDGDHHHAHHHAPGSLDPHIWLDPLRALRMVSNIRDAFIEMDPEGEAVYRANADAFAGEIEQLHRAFEAAAPVLEGLRIVTFHDAYSYLARRYGFDIAGVLVTSHGREPDARHMRALIDSIRELGVSAVMVEPQFDPRLARAIADEAGLPVIALDPMGETYIGMMRGNLQALLKAARGGGAR